VREVNGKAVNCAAPFISRAGAFSDWLVWRFANAPALGLANLETKTATVAHGHGGEFWNIRSISMKKFVFAAICTFAMVGFVTAEEFMARITKIDGNKITFAKGFKKDADAKDSTAEAAKDVKVMNGEFKKGDAGFKMEPGDAIKDGLKNEMFTKMDEKGVFAQITTNDKGQITQIVATKGFGKGFGGKKKGQQ